MWDLQVLTARPRSPPLRKFYFFRLPLLISSSRIPPTVSTLLSLLVLVFFLFTHIPSHHPSLYFSFKLRARANPSSTFTLPFPFSFPGLPFLTPNLPCTILNTLFSLLHQPLCSSTVLPSAAAGEPSSRYGDPWQDERTSPRGRIFRMGWVRRRGSLFKCLGLRGHACGVGKQGGRRWKLYRREASRAVRTGLGWYPMTNSLPEPRCAIICRMRISLPASPTPLCYLHRTKKINTVLRQSAIFSALAASASGFLSTVRSCNPHLPTDAVTPRCYFNLRTADEGNSKIADRSTYTN